MKNGRGRLATMVKNRLQSDSLFFLCQDEALAATGPVVEKHVQIATVWTLLFGGGANRHPCRDCRMARNQNIADILCLRTLGKEDDDSCITVLGTPVCHFNSQGAPAFGRGIAYAGGAQRIQPKGLLIGSLRHDNGIGRCRQENGSAHFQPADGMIRDPRNSATRFLELRASIWSSKRATSE